MATVINNPDSGNGAGTIIGVVIAVVLVALLVIYGIPALRGGGSTTEAPGASANIDVNLPSGNGGSGETGGTQ